MLDPVGRGEKLLVLVLREAEQGHATVTHDAMPVSLGEAVCAPSPGAAISRYNGGRGPLLVERTLSDDSQPESRCETQREDEPVPQRIGRYVVLERVGSGSMGVVYGAYDPDLDRRVAVKVLHRRRRGRRASARMVREAQALAKLSHPNVVAVHDVGTFGDQLFVAMEHVDGLSLSEWLLGLPPADKDHWRRVLPVLLGAARGLAAAHRSGFIHRDFKPENVLVEPGDRARVVDFGLAARTGVDSSSIGPLGLLDEESSSWSTSSQELVRRQSSDSEIRPLADAPGLTREGSVLGTPAYMAPEQFEGRPAEPRSDQFSFCVTLYEALYGHRPFRGSSSATIAYHVLGGQIREEPPGTRVPSWLRRVVLRGLSRDVEERWPSMDELIAQLERDPARAARRWLFGGVSVATVAVSAGMLGRATTPTEGVCSGSDEELSAVYGAQRRTRVRQALLETRLPYAEQTAALVFSRLDDYTRSWRERHREACLSHRRGEQSERMLDQRMACLQRRRLELDATLRVFEEANEDVVRYAVASLETLGPIHVCDDLEGLRDRREPPSNPQVRAQVELLESELVSARALGAAGRFAAGLTDARSLAKAARPLDYPPLLAQVLLTQGRLEDLQGEYEASHRTLTEAWRTALAAGDDRLAILVSSELVRVTGYRLHRFEDAESRARDAEALLERLRSRSEPSVRLLSGELAHARAMVAYRQEQFVEALALLREAESVFVEELGPEHRKVADVYNVMGNVRVAEHRFAAALGHYRKALELRQRLLGPRHPDVGGIHNNIGLALKNLQSWDEAIAHLQPGLEILEGQLAPDHPNLLMVVRNLANTYRASGRYEDAVDLYARWLAEVSEVSEPRFDVAMSRAELSVRLGRVDDGVRQAKTAVEALVGIPEPAVAAPVHTRYANLLVETGQPETAVEEYRRAIELWDAAGSDDLERDGWLQVQLGKALSVEHRGEGVRTVEHGLSMLEASGASPGRRLEVRRWLRETEG